MIRVMSFAINQGKVAIHCHAGLGRTGVLIACYLIFTRRISADEAVTFVRSKRPNSIQTRNQLAFIQQFADYLKPLRIVYPHSSSNEHEFTLSQYLDRQRQLLHGYEGRRLKMIPKIVYICCEQMLSGIHRGQPNITDEDVPHHHRISFLHQRGQRQNLGPPPASAAALQRISTSLDIDTYGRPATASSANQHVRPKLNKSQSDSALQPGEGSTGVVGSEMPVIGDDDDDESLDSENVLPLTARDSMDEHSGECADIVRAFSQFTVDTDAMRRVEEIKSALNNSNDGWEVIYAEHDNTVLSTLLWTWLEHLQEPVLTRQELRKVSLSEDVSGSEDVLRTLRRLSQSARHLLEYLCGVVARLLEPPTAPSSLLLSDSAEPMIVRVISALTCSHLTYTTYTSSGYPLSPAAAVAALADVPAVGPGVMLPQAQQGPQLAREDSDRLYSFVTSLVSVLHGKFHATAAGTTVTAAASTSTRPTHDE